jgi:signal transduction histidine kinase
VLDDSPLERELAARTLARDFDVATFGDGATLLEQLAAGGDPDVLVLDWHLPGLSGPDVLTFVRRTRDEASLPVLMLTGARMDAPDLVKALEGGANDFVTKPFISEVLRARVHTLARVRALHERLRATELEARARSDFEEQLVGIVSHDLRNPLFVVALSAASLEGRPGLDARQTKAIARIVSASARAIRMVEDLLDFSRIRVGGDIGLTTAPVDIHALVAQVADEVLVTRPDRRIALEAIGDGRGIWDADRLTQVAQNLIGNAVQHTTEDVPVRVRTSGEAQHVVLTVHNGGPAIAAEDLPRLFEPFHQGRTAHGNGRSLGLGLYITSHIVQAHGGYLDVHSTADEGTTFRVVLPREAQRTTDSRAGGRTGT